MPGGTVTTTLTAAGVSVHSSRSARDQHVRGTIVYIIPSMPEILIVEM